MATSTFQMCMKAIKPITGTSHQSSPSKYSGHCLDCHCMCIPYSKRRQDGGWHL